MKKSSISSISTTTTPTPPALLLQRPTTSTTTTTASASHTSYRATPAIIPLDYNYSTMSPSTYHSRHSTAASRQATDVDVEVDIDVDPMQYSSLFGDPVPPPPPTDFLGAAFSFRPTVSTSIDIGGSSEEEQQQQQQQLPFGRTVTLSTHSRLFSDVPYSSSISRRFSNISSMRNFDVLPHLKPPDIQILPNSSGGSSSEPRDSPNFALLTPDDMMRRSTLYDISEPDTNMLELTETMSISDATGRREYSEATRRVSSFAEDFKSNVGSFSHSQLSELSPPAPPPPLPQSYARQCSNESYSSNEWFRPASHDFPEFSKMPKLRPSSKNVISIKRDEMPMQHSPVAAMINDSNGSSSGGEERLLDTTQTLEHPTVSLDALAPARPPDPSPSCLREIETDLLLSPQEYLKQRKQIALDVLEENFSPPPPPAEPPPPVPPAPALEEYEFMPQEAEDDEAKPNIRREMSPVILKDLVATGGDYRIDQPRSHKKSSFTIISDRSPQTSRVQSPSAHLHKKTSKEPVTTSTSSTAKPIAKPRHHLQRRSFTSTQLRLPQLSLHPTGPMTSDDSPRPSVQFNMTGRHSPSKMPQKGILQYRESLTSSQDTPLPIQRRRPSSTTLPPAYDSKMKSCETLPLITDPYRTAIPRLHRSSLDLGRETAIFPPGALPRPLKSNPNPTRQQRGLLRIINSADSMSRIPLRSNWTSLDNLLVQEKLRRTSLSPPSIQNRRRSSSTSPERRSSTLTASDRRSSNLSTVTTSDFSFRRPSLLQQPQRKQSIATTASPTTKRRGSIMPGVSPTTPRRQSIAAGASPTSKRRQSIVPPNNFGLRSRTARTKIAKPTTLSPIIGTPNKDSSTPQSPTNAAALSTAASDTISDVTSRRDSLSKIPIRNGVTSVTSQANSRVNSQPGSRVHSRSSSPLKEFTAQLPLSGRTSRATSSRSPSRATVRSTATSRANSRAPSRSTSRASTRPISRGPPSRASSRPNSRMELAKELANSRSNSRLSWVSTVGGEERLRAGSVSPSVGIGRRRRESIVPDRRKSISLSPHAMRRGASKSGFRVGQRRRSISPTGKLNAKNRGGAVGEDKARMSGRSAALGQRRDSRSRIPTRAKSGVNGAGAGTVTASSSKSPPKSKGKTKATISPPRKPPVPQRKQPSSAKKAPGSVQKPESSVKRTPSSVGKQATATKKQPSTLQKSGTAAASQIKREVSNVQRKPPIPSRTTGNSKKPPKRDASSLSMKKTPADKNELKRQTSSKNLKKTADTKAAPTTGNDGKVNAAVEKGGTTESNDVSGNADAGPITAPTASTPRHLGGSGGGSSGGGGVAKLKRQVSNVSLIRLGSRISLQSKKRSDSPLSGNITEEAAINSGDNNDKLVSMTTAAITAQVTSSMANQHLALSAEDTSNAATAASAILEKSQKTLENIQQKVTNATDDIHKTINDNLTDLKSMEQDMGKVSDGATSPTASITTVVENKSGKTGASVSRGGTAEEPKKSTATAGQRMKDNGVGKVGAKGTGVGGAAAAAAAAAAVSSQKSSPQPPTQPIEAAVSVLNAGAMDAAAERNYEVGSDGKGVGDSGGAQVNAAAAAAAALSSAAAVGAEHVNSVAASSSGGNGDDFKTDAKRRSPDGQGGSATESAGGKTGSQEFLEEKDDADEAEPRGCCRCCTKFCMPCRRSARCSRCCRRNKKTKLHDESEEPVLSATSSATTTNLEVIDETRPQPPHAKSKTSCWQKLNCCKRCRKKPPTVGAAQEEMATAQQHTKMATIREEAPAPAAGPAKQSKCGLCLSKVFCCRSVNKVETTTGAETEVKKCCFCIPCRRKRAAIGAAGATVAAIGAGGGGSAAWQDPEAGLTATDAPVLDAAEAALQKQGCCKRFWSKLLCCCKKPAPPVASDSRRASMKAPPPPAEDTRRKLHVDLVEYNSKMKGAIPVLPLWLAWFCAICNMVIPGLGTLLSGLFCLCVGIPRFSQYDSAKARVGAFIINVIVAVSQLFCVLFCFVGWGWSIWWGTIMLKCARKLNKIKKVERLEMEEEKRQEAAAAAAARAITVAKVTTAAPAPVPAPTTTTTTAAATATAAAALPAEAENAAAKT